MTRNIQDAKSLGPMAVEVLSSERRGRLMGTTSRGLFLQTTSRWLVFLSWEPWRGPQTVNVSHRLEGLAAGDRVHLEPGWLELPTAAIRWSPADTWSPGPPPGPSSSGEVRRERVRLLLSEADRRGRRSAMASLLEVQGAVDPLGLLGLGPGLTPSGDDVVAGMLLARRRRLGGTGPVDLLREAARRTTSLSANLLELASRGEAEERLLALCDHVLTGAPCGWEFLDWGAHSGLDVLVGMGLEERMPEGW